MALDSETAPVSTPALWIGWLLTALVGAGLGFSAAMKFMAPPEAAEGFSKLGWDINLAFTLGVIEISCTIIYLFPRTAVLGAILLTGYLGGAVATHVRIYDNFVAPIIAGVLVWGALYLRDRRLRALVPWRS